MIQAYEVQPKRADAFFELAAQTRGTNPLAAKAIELSGKIAELRHFAYELALERALPPTQIQKSVQDDCNALRAKARKLELAHNQASQPASRRAATRLALHATLMDALVLTPALQTYPPGNDNASIVRGRIGTNWPAIRRMAMDARDEARAHHEDIHAANAVTDLTLLGLTSRTKNFMHQVLPALFGGPHAAESELFMQTSDYQVWQSHVHTTYLAF